MPRDGSFALAFFGRVRKVQEPAFAVAAGRNSFARKRILEAALVIGVKTRTLAMGVVRHLKAGLPVPKLLDKPGIVDGRAAGLQRGAGSARRAHFQTIRTIESTAVVMLSTWVASLVEHVAATRLIMKVQAAPVGAAGATVPLVRVDRSVLREFIIERHSPLLAARWGYAERVGAVAYGGHGGQK